MPARYGLNIVTACIQNKLGESKVNSFSIFHWIIIVAVSAIWIVPTVKIIQKAGYSGWWFLITLVPIANLIVYWMFAFGNWPILRRSVTENQINPP